MNRIYAFAMTTDQIKAHFAISDLILDRIEQGRVKPEHALENRLLEELAWLEWLKETESRPRP